MNRHSSSAGASCTYFRRALAPKASPSQLAWPPSARQHHPRAASAPSSGRGVRRRSLHQALRGEGRVSPRFTDPTTSRRPAYISAAVARRVARGGLVAVVGRGDDREAAAVGRETRHVPSSRPAQAAPPQEHGAPELRYGVRLRARRRREGCHAFCSYVLSAAAGIRRRSTAMFRTARRRRWAPIVR